MTSERKSIRSIHTQKKGFCLNRHGSKSDIKIVIYWGWRKRKIKEKKQIKNKIKLITSKSKHSPYTVKRLRPPFLARSPCGRYSYAEKQSKGK